MTYLIDSDWVIDYLRGRGEAGRLISELASEPISLSIISYGEVYDGILHGANRLASEAALRQFVSAVRVLPLTLPAMRRYTHIRGFLRQQGQRLADNDLLIAATALHYDRMLVTRNRAHFGRVPGLRLYQ